MSFALTAGVSGLQAHQKMLDIAGNNLANINTTAYKSSTVTFSELLSQTIKSASQPTSSTGGTNPQQLGSGVGVASITRNLSQGNIVSTDSSLDMAIDGEGYFVLSDGEQDVYTRIGSFGVDANSYLVDNSTGYRVQRIDDTGESDGFQNPSVSDIKVPYSTALPASATTSLTLSGNLSSDGTKATTAVLSSNVAYTLDNGTTASGTSLISDLSQFSGTFASGEEGTINITGTARDGSIVTSSIAVDATTTLNDLITQINTALNSSDAANGSTATLTSDGNIQITDNASGYSKTDVSLAYTSSTGGTDSLKLPTYFKLITAGGNETQTVNISIVDAQGGKHTLTAAFVRTDTLNTWDLVLTNVTGDIAGLTDRRIEGLTFTTTSAYAGLADATEPTSFGIRFANDPTVTQTLSTSLGSLNSYDGLTQFSGASTAVVNKQDGYEAGSLTSVAVEKNGVLVGTFSNGIKKDIATIQVALFQNPAGLEAVGNGYYLSSANSGEAIATTAQSGGAGSISGSSLEESNVDTAVEFVTMIEAQNGYQANARTITVANDILKELTNLIR